jgi:DNA-3-methyladenine glycosylase
MKILPREFFDRDAVSVAREMLGKFVVVGNKVGRIVETEAYHEGDPASHSFSGKGFRNAVMFGGPGRAYVYFTYGMYHCFNVVCGGEGRGEAVLIRAVEPVEGVDEMKENRGLSEVKNLCSGPAKFCIAFGIDKGFNGKDLCSGEGIGIYEGDEVDFDVVETTRIGISKGVELPYRFYVKGNKFVSRK